MFGIKKPKESLEWVKKLALHTMKGKTILDLLELRLKMKEIKELLNNPTYCRCDINECGSLISIIIPTKNEEAYLPKLLMSLKMQNYKNYEVIVIDYMSSDRTVEIAKKFNAKVIKVERPGIGYADHIGVLESKGDIVVKTDADVIFLPNTLCRMIKVFDTINKLKLYHVAHLYIDGPFFVNLVAYIADKYWRQPWVTLGHFIAFKKDIYGNKVYFNINLNFGEDIDFGRKVYEVYGAKAIYYDKNNFVLTSARRMRKVGLINYALGYKY